MTSEDVCVDMLIQEKGQRCDPAAFSLSLSLLEKIKFLLLEDLLCFLNSKFNNIICHRIALEASGLCARTSHHIHAVLNLLRVYVMELHML